MTATTVDFGPSLQHCSKSDWIAEVAELVEYDGSSARLGKRHSAFFTEHGKTLLVSFETLQGIRALSPKAQPMGWKMVKNNGWSCLSLVSDGDTWFRNPAVYAYFDHLVDDGFFEEFDRVLFFGAGPCGYAAAAFSVVAPGARVLAIQPQATLDPARTEWDRRFPEQRRVSFSGRFGYAPDMLEAAECAYVVYDPLQTEDAMHATLFSGPNVQKRRLRHMGSALQTDLLQMDALYGMLEAAAAGALTPSTFARLTRARRNHLPYLKRVLARLDRDDRTELARVLCHNVSARMRAPGFAQRLAELNLQDA
ncbi:MAG: phosphoadenosine phosphosulfate reductase [Roseobacter sp.]|nr:phosphoadenosine phosphosulfate reductase [Roseobacter sp.]